MFKCIIYERNLFHTTSHIAVYDPYRISPFSHLGFSFCFGVYSNYRLIAFSLMPVGFAKEGDIIRFPRGVYSHFGIYIGKLTL